MLNMVDICVKRGQRVVLNDFNLTITPGDAYGLVGANGSGKTSLILAVLDLLPFSGAITRSYSPNQLGVMWQDRGLPLNANVDRWLKYLADLFQSPIDHELLERFDVKLEKKSIREVSGGEMQKLAIVSAFFHNPTLLILDEPTVGLDEISRLQFHELCRERIAKGSSVLITSHLNSDIISITSNITHLSQGPSVQRCMFSTSRPLSDAEINVLKSVNIISEITKSENGYIASTSGVIFTYLAQFAVDNNLQITSYADLS